MVILEGMWMGIASPLKVSPLRNQHILLLMFSFSFRSEASEHALQTLDLYTRHIWMFIFSGQTNKI